MMRHRRRGTVSPPPRLSCLNIDLPSHICSCHGRPHFKQTCSWSSLHPCTSCCHFHHQIMLPLISFEHPSFNTCFPLDNFVILISVHQISKGRTVLDHRSCDLVSLSTMSLYLSHKILRCDKKLRERRFGKIWLDTFRLWIMFSIWGHSSVTCNTFPWKIDTNPPPRNAKL